MALASCCANDVSPAVTRPDSTSTPTNLPIGICVSSIGKFNFPDDSFRATLYVSGVLPKGQEKLLTRLDFLNADNVGILNSTTVDGTNGSVTYQKITGTFNYDWKLKNYPFDHHTLRICIDACEKKESLRLVADEAASGYKPEITGSGPNASAVANGWIVSGFRVLSSPTNTLQISVHPESSLSDSTITAEIDVRRCSYSIFWKMTAAAFASIILVMICYFLPIEGPENMSPYFATYVGAVFAIVINLKSANTELGSSSVVTLIDKIYLEALAFVMMGAFVTLFGRLRIAKGSTATSINRQRALIGLISLIGITTLIGLQVYLAVVSG